MERVGYFAVGPDARIESLPSFYLKDVYESPIVAATRAFRKKALKAALSEPRFVSRKRQIGELEELRVHESYEVMKVIFKDYQKAYERELVQDATDAGAMCKLSSLNMRSNLEEYFMSAEVQKFKLMTTIDQETIISEEPRLASWTLYAVPCIDFSPLMGTLCLSKSESKEISTQPCEELMFSSVEAACAMACILSRGEMNSFGVEMLKIGDPDRRKLRHFSARKSPMAEFWASD
ncbi:unnamed protein product, partial [Symbiodinium sp. CCMP2592]